LIVPDFVALQKYCTDEGIAFTSNDLAIKDQAVIDLFTKEIARLNLLLGNTEQVKKFKLMSNEWTIDSGELTATLKLRRKFILNKYKQQVQSLYMEESVQV
jgi:long-chain acyl-CoA synthetase